MQAAKWKRLAATAVFAGAAFVSAPVHAILVTSNTNATALAAALTVGSTGLVVISSSLQGHTQGAATSSGTFTNASGTYNGIGSVFGGVVISSGNVNNYNDGANTSTGQTTDYGAAATPAQQALLGPISGQASHFDVTQLDITFTTATGNLFFQAVFGSEEFPEFVGSAFIDAFGLYLDGTNIAFVNGLPVNINHPAMAAIAGTELDGVLAPGGNPVLTFSASGLAIGAPHTMTFILGDASDRILDTTIYLSSFGATPPPNGVAEPGTLALLGAGLAGFAWLRRRQKQP